MSTKIDAEIKQFIKEAQKANLQSEEDITDFKNNFAKRHKKSTLANYNIVKTYHALVKNGQLQEDPEFLKRFRKRKIRSLSGVSVITVLTKPWYCPGKCVFCPTEKDMPKSYLSNEPGAMRAVLNDFDPTRQIKTRLRSLQNQGHPTDKVEIIVLGGTFSAYPHAYQTAFIRNLYNALNGTNFRSLKKAQKYNETTTHRCIALSLETRPDHITKNELRRFRQLGCTKLQIGIQSIYDDVLKLNKRGETVEQGIKAVELARDAGFKFSFHIMPNLPGSTPERDYQMMEQLFKDPAYKPDFLKLYPCTVVPYSELEKWWERGEYQPYDDDTLLKLIIKSKKLVPEYCRIDRLVRDIPGESILAGNLSTNLRQLIQIKEKKPICRCIRCREIRNDTVNPKNISLKVQEFEAAHGQEFFLTYDDTKKDKLLSLLRLRFPSYLLGNKKHFISELQNAAIIREIHTYGFQVEIGKTNKNASQHLGLGRKLLKKAEQITKKAGFNKIAVIASIGTREYYRKFGYHLEGTYMVKSL
ncbi:tRNA uridine(34) 5-carboxymethylaminomethyl modification radical SAM/GNAT enzyme Elp3 [Candidatus Peregrinibacteria bacterium]|jgi:elongator complex protein 3|nr:tRNA uridine(34) 5-carboxymethylaminomethyl modification radical SAM/GNAT enzyme Elp3 [Candidatus Peregrinibacteria bacterium]MBT7484079.1 tRNA uridine(34) 5-carboxymethylaminomethyl modification radical SAM/GNAT enzyme Elp3 [Candidatus Peregrinibacteria bacterium]MBT7703516.1 tRNA uridine(34) 5-carboxymethylaminomethyl modification radical SAM/GNAT enzyme Elp3 [Candidatus Peregrinibacteria bacterium]